MEKLEQNSVRGQNAPKKEGKSWRLLRYKVNLLQMMTKCVGAE